MAKVTKISSENSGINPDSDVASNGFERSSPLRRQYLEIKKQNPDAIVLFRLGDFYETFDEDAHTASSVLEITLTGRDMGKAGRVPMAGVPAQALEVYLARLIKRGYKVAICEQVSDPTTGPGLVDREVVRIVTPGTVIEPSLLNEKTNKQIEAILTDEQKKKFKETQSQRPTRPQGRPGGEGKGKQRPGRSDA